MSRNKKIEYGDKFRKSIKEDISEEKVPVPSEGKFTFDRTDITFDSLIRKFDEK